MDATNLPIDGVNPKDDKGSQLNLGDLTDQQWLFIKHYIDLGDIREAYKRASYEGIEASAPYQVFKRLKPYIEEVLNHSVSRLRLMKDLDKALAIPLIDKERLTVSEWLRLRKFAGSLIPELKDDRKISVLVINRHAGEKGNPVNSGLDNNPKQHLDPSNIIDVDPIG